MQVERWWKQSVSDWNIEEYADRQEYMFLQTVDLAEADEPGEDWKGPNTNA